MSVQSEIQLTIARIWDKDLFISSIEKVSNLEVYQWTRFKPIISQFYDNFMTKERQYVISKSIIDFHDKGYILNSLTKMLVGNFGVTILRLRNPILVMSSSISLYDTDYNCEVTAVQSSSELSTSITITKRNLIIYQITTTDNVVIIPEIIRIRSICQITLDSYHMDGLYSLQDLDLSDSSLTIEDNAFSSLVSLSRLTLANCKLDIFNDNLISTCSGSLKYLDLSNNNLTEVPTILLTNLEVLNLSGNRINTYLLNFNPISKLMSINLSNNEISDFKPPLFYNCHNLRDVNFSHNNITEFKRWMFNNQRYLSVVDFSYNMITELILTDISPFTNLIIIHLNNNLIKDISSPVHPNIPKLTSLDLSNNIITDLCENVMRVMISNISIVDCSHNNIRSIGWIPKRYRNNDAIFNLVGNPLSYDTILALSVFKQFKLENSE